MAPVVEKVVENKSTPEVVDPLKQCLIIVDHKIRNLEKRKKKIEIYREDQRKGQTLNADQLSALSKYVEVVRTLELAQELRKQFDGIAAETAKQQKKQMKKEAHERGLQETARVKDILALQDVLQSMGLDEVREDFLAGRNGAVKITQEELGHLDAIYEVVFPKRVPEEPVEKPLPFNEQLTVASEHLLAIVEGKQKEVVGTTYKQLKELISRINDSGYLDKTSGQDGTTVEPKETIVEDNLKKPLKNVDNKSASNGWS